MDLLVRFNAALALETEDLALDPERLRAGVRAVFDDPARGAYLVAELDGRPVGALLVTSEWSDWRAGRMLWIQSVYVEPAARGRGVYRALHERVLADARASADVRGVRLYVERGNRAAQAVYRALGMQASGYVLFEQGLDEPRANAGQPRS